MSPRMAASPRNAASPGPGMRPGGNYNGNAAGGNGGSGNANGTNAGNANGVANRSTSINPPPSGAAGGRGPSNTRSATGKTGIGGSVKMGVLGTMVQQQQQNVQQQQQNVQQQQTQALSDGQRPPLSLTPTGALTPRQRSRSRNAGNRISEGEECFECLILGGNEMRNNFKLCEMT
jgi:hypothetical protein